MKVLIMAKKGKKVVNLNRRKAGREKCLNCSAWFYPDVTNCEFDDCDLYPFRSGQGKQNSKERAKSILRYCLSCCNGQISEVSKCPSIDCSLFPYRQNRVDKSAEIKSLPKNGRIGLPEED